MAYIKTAEVKEIRLALKEKFGKKFKFSVTKRDGGLAVQVAIMSGLTDFSNLWASKTEDDYGYGYTNINHYHITEKNYGDNVELFKEIDTIIKTAPAKAEGGREYFDHSDSMTDYFHVAYYYDIQVGKWDKPYAQVA
jgi:pyruvate formate-lyase activating enzyme-like uncharacterized protein